MKITILCEKNSWVNKYLPSLLEKLKRHSVQVISSHHEIVEGDLLILQSYGKILPKNKMALNRHNILVHSSELPRGKGWTPVHWQIIEGKDRIPSTLIEISEKVDSGDIYYKEYTSLNGTELLDEIREKVIKTDFSMIERFVDNIEVVKAKRQEGKATYYRKRNEEDSEFDINKTISEQISLMRVVDNEDYPLFFRYKGEKFVLKIYKEKDSQNNGR